LTRAAELIDKSTKSHPSSDAWIALGALQDRLERYEEAEQSYRHALARQPDRADALNNLAYLLVLRKKDLPEARTLIDRAIQTAGPRGALRDSRAMVELATGDTNAALADSDYACSDDLSPVHLLHQAQIRFAKGERNAAATALKKARQLGLTRASLHPLEHPVLTELETQLEVAGQ
jgi:Tfp pilus assembly protein PilF